MSDSEHDNSSHSEEASTQSPKKPAKRRNLRVAERVKLIEDYKNGITDRFYSVSPHPTSPGEYVIRKRRTPLSYDVVDAPRRAGDDVRCNTQQSEPQPEPSAPPPSTMLQATPSSGPSVEFFSMQSALNANLQRELDALHEKFNKLDAKMRKERAAAKRKAGGKANTNKREKASHETPISSPDVEYEYEYVDEPVTQAPDESIPGVEEPSPALPPPSFTSPWTPYIRRRHIDIRDF